MSNGLEYGVYFDPDDPHFRAGACQGALWLALVARHLVEENRSREEISAYLADLLRVALKWQNAEVDMPTGPPWAWDDSDLEHFISMHKDDWPRDGSLV